MIFDEFNSVDFDKIMDEAINEAIRKSYFNRLSFFLYKLDKNRFRKYMDPIVLAAEVQAQWNNAVIIKGLTDG